MKREKREVYLKLAAEIDWTLCGFCKYSESLGCGDGMECHHPIERISEDAPGFYPNEDCWAYRPNLPVSDIADIVGIILSNGWRTAYYLEYPDTGRIEVYGSSRRDLALV